MVFSSLIFIYFFLPVMFLVYIVSKPKTRNFVLLVFGLLFYAWGEPVYIYVMLISSFVDYYAGLYMSRTKNQYKRRTSLIISMVVDLGFLFVFKYSGFVVNIVNSCFGTSFNVPDLPLPIGISFYTFQSMSYTIDIYQNKVKVQKNFLDYLTYVSLFPQLVAGPIVRYEDVQYELTNRKVNAEGVGEGVGRFIKGLCKKVLLANNIGVLWAQVKAMDYSEISAVTAWMGILAFTFQIYFDFSGYSDMAIGLGKMLGFNFPENFDHPYMSKSISEFWRRWHMTLGGWFRSYVYIPLGGNRCGKAKTLRNLAVVWFLTGLWHGASWNFIIWGLFYGALIIAERLGFAKVLQKIPPALSTAYTFLMVVIGWVFFDTENIADAFRYLKAMFFTTDLCDSLALYQFKSFILIFILCIFAATDIWTRLINNVHSRQSDGRLFMYAVPAVQVAMLFLCTCYLVDSTYNPFLYFNF
ncbi:MAG: MBOAT family O-acyltransferase [Oscillospiraceae bacterium]|nr:MBOAT family O-acyltransferase [Oscillospiraceae bacterium]